MTVQHDAAAAKRVGEQAVRAGLCVAALNGEHSFRMRQVPGLAAVALFEARKHQLRAHRPVAEKRPFFDRVQQLLLHHCSASCRASA